LASTGSHKAAITIATPIFAITTRNVALRAKYGQRRWAALLARLRRRSKQAKWT
jgi:hypothetical protein